MWKFPILMDGATGTVLITAGMKQDQQVAEYVLNNKNVLLKAQKNYISAGSQLLMTSTFGVNSVKYPDNFRELNRELFAITKQAVSESGENVLIAGEMSPSGLFLEPYGDATFEDIYKVFYDQAQVLAECGADVIALSTMYSLPETRIAVLAAKDACGLDVLASMTVDEHGKTMSGNDILACIAVLQAVGASAVGMNCSNGPIEMSKLVEKSYDIANIPLMVKPNAGADVSKYLETDVFSEYMVKMFKNGANILGGCCGTDSSYIQQIKKDIFNDEFINKYKKNVKNIDDNDFYILSSEKNVFKINKSLNYVETMNCADFIEEMTDLEFDDSVIYVKIDDENDTEEFLMNVFMADLPIFAVCKKFELAEMLAKKYCGILIMNGNYFDELQNKILRSFGTILV